MSGIIAFAIFESYSIVNPKKFSYNLLNKLGISAITETIAITETTIHLLAEKPKKSF